MARSRPRLVVLALAVAGTTSVGAAAGCSGGSSGRRPASAAGRPSTTRPGPATTGPARPGGAEGADPATDAFCQAARALDAHLRAIGPTQDPEVAKGVLRDLGAFVLHADADPPAEIKGDLETLSHFYRRVPGVVDPATGQPFPKGDDTPLPFTAYADAGGHVKAFMARVCGVSVAQLQA